MAQKVLVVQYDAKSAQALTRYFKERGDQVWEAWEMGQAQAQYAQVKPDLILQDLHFPGEDWIQFLRQAKQDNPKVKVILTNQYPDVKREMLAKSGGFFVFLRQPFHDRWIDLALRRLEGIDAPTRPAAPTTRAVATPTAPQVRMPVRLKITVPYLILALLFALAAAFVVSQVVYESVQDRYFNQLIATGKQSADWMVREEDRLLGTLRLIANTQGVSQAIQAGNAEALRELVLPLAVNAGEEAIDLLDLRGVTVFSAHRGPDSQAGDFEFSRGNTAFLGQEFVQRVLLGEIDERGDKFADFVRSPWGDLFYVSGPVYNESNQLVGAVLVGTSAQSMVRAMKAETLGETTLYNLEGQSLATTLVGGAAAALQPQEVIEVLALQDQSSRTRPLTVSSVAYTELLGPWEARQQTDLGLMGVALPQAFLARTSQVTRLQVFLLIALGIILVIAVGLYLANLITRPLQTLVRASSQVAQGNLGVKVNTSGNDELSVLAHTFNTMIAGLQEGSMYRDLLGRTVSPEVRDQLRQIFNTGSLRLEGQQAVATVLMSDIRGFTTLSEQSDPASVMRWLNEYFDRVVPIVVKYGGVVNKFDGDALLAFFGILPRMLSPKKSALAACQAALEMQQAIDELNEIREKRGDPLLITGIGVNTGVVIAGSLGARDRMHYTIIGDTVNTTQRLESLTRQVLKSSGILVGHATYTALDEMREGLFFEPLGLHSVKGKLERVMVYRLAQASQTQKIDVML